MTEEVKEEHIFVAFCDGSSRPNPGFGGFGVFGYTLKTSKRPSRVKFPIGTKYNFTSKGIVSERDTLPYETNSIVEYIGSCDSLEATNNLTEILALSKTLELARVMEGLTLVRVYTDSKYVINSFTEYLPKWKENGWTRKDGKPISHENEWKYLDVLKETMKDMGITLEVNWVKGHSDDTGNRVADIYAVAGSNFSRIQLLDGRSGFETEVYSRVSTYNEYKESLLDRDIVFYFRDLFFSSMDMDDSTFCFLSTSDDETQIGKKDTASIFVVNQGYVPDIVNDAKRIFRNVPRNYVTNCCIKLSRLNEDRVLLRLANIIGIDKLLVPVNHYTVVRLHLINDNTPFITEHTMDYPYSVDASRIFSSSLDILQSLEKGQFNVWQEDISDLFINGGKVILTSKDKNLDITTRFNVPFQFLSSLILATGKDFPPYLALKHIEEKITKVTALIELRPDSNYVTLYTLISMEDRQLISVNVVNKFVVLRHS